MNRKRILSGVLVLAVVLTLLPTAAWAEGDTSVDEGEEPESLELASEEMNVPSDAKILYSGTCGDNLTWMLDSNGLLTISGTGAMTSSPWSSYSSSIVSVDIKDGVTNIVKWAFSSCYNLTSVTIPSSVTKIEAYAFRSCSALTTIAIPDCVTVIEECAFSGCKSLSYAPIPSGVTRIEDNVFSDCSSLISVTIPSNVTSLGSGAFSYCVNLTSITIPDSVTSIGGMAFRGCSSLTSITIPSGVTTIGSQTFDDCVSLTSVTIPNSVTKISSWAFANCSSLTSITIPDSVTTIGGYAFSNSSLTSITIPNSVTSIDVGAFSNCDSLESVTLPSNLTSIESHTFSNCGRLTSMTIPSGVTSIGVSAFEFCRGLTSVTVPDNLATIGQAAFNGCSSLTAITIPDNVTSIGSGAFCNCSSLVSITIPDNVTSIESSTFSGCSSLISITIPDSVNEIRDTAFSRCYALWDVYYNETKTQWESIYIGQDNQPLLNAIIHYKSVPNCEHSETDTVRKHEVDSTCITAGSYEEVVECSFCGAVLSRTAKEKELVGHTYGDWTVIQTPTETETGLQERTCSICGDLEQEILPVQRDNSCGGDLTWTLSDDGVLTISGTGKMTDYSCDYETSSSNAPWWESAERIYSVKIEDGVTSIGSYSFYNCKNLKYVSIPDSVNDIGEYSFFECRNLTSVSLSDSVTSIGDYAFAYCENLTSASMPAYVTYFGAYVFKECTALASVTIPNGATRIGDDAFYDCKSLTAITIPNSVTSIGSYAFHNCTGLTTVVIPDSVTAIELGTFEKCSRLASVTMSKKITSIGPFAFSNCSSLAAIDLPNTLTSLGDGAFSHCISLTSISIPNSLTKISSAFACCTGLTSVTIPESVKSLVKGEFSGCTGLTSVMIPNSVQSIGAYAFSGCNKLTAIIIPNSVTSIGEKAFYNCTGLTTVTIPSSVTSIEKFAFYGCSRLSSIYFGGDAPTAYEKGYYAPSFPANTTLYYIEGKEGWTPNWKGYQTDTWSITNGVSFYPENGATLNLDGLAKDKKLRMMFDKEVTSISGRAVLNGALEIHRLSDDEVVYSVKGINITRRSVLLWGNGTPYTAVRLEDAASKLKYGETYYVTAPEGFIHFTDGTESPAIEKGDWVFQTNKGSTLEFTLPTSSGSVKVGEKITLKPTVSDGENTSSVQVVWTSDDATVASVDSNGVIIGVQEGTTTIRGTATSSEGEKKTVEYQVTVTPVVGIALRDTTLQMKVNDSAALVYTCRPDTAAVTFESSDPSIAAVSDGRVTAVSAGSATITATASYNGDTAFAECTVTVVAETKAIAQKFAEIAKEQVGKKGVSWFNFGGGPSWSGSFVGWCAEQLGISSIIGDTKGASSYPAIRDRVLANGGQLYYYNNRDIYGKPDGIVGKGFTPQVGDIAIMNDGNHLGIVVDVTSTTVTVVHGDWHTGGMGYGDGVVCGPGCTVKGCDGAGASYTLSTGRGTQGSICGYLRPNWDKAADAASRPPQPRIDAFHCPVEVIYSYNGETLDSATGQYEASFGSMKVEGEGDEKSITVTLYDSYDVDITVIGTGSGTMTMTSTYSNAEEETTTRTFEDVPIQEDTMVNVYAGTSEDDATLVVHCDDGETIQEVWRNSAEDATVNGMDEELTQWYFSSNSESISYQDEPALACERVDTDGVSVVVAKIDNNTSATITCKVYAAAYADGKMITCTVSDTVSVTSGKSDSSVRLSLPYPSEYKGKITVKVFLLDADTLAPLTGAQTVST
jgi:hypothetical protein